MNMEQKSSVQVARTGAHLFQRPAHSSSVSSVSPSNKKSTTTTRTKREKREEEERRRRHQIAQIAINPSEMGEALRDVERSSGYKRNDLHRSITFLLKLFFLSFFLLLFEIFFQFSFSLKEIEQEKKQRQKMTRK